VIGELIERLISRESGLVDHIDDLGGPTNMGITIGTFRDRLGRPATVKEVRGFPGSVAFDIYQSNCWVNPGFSELLLSPC
jgi:lysozyme family protein